MERERVQRNAGTAGIVAGVLLILLFILIISIGLRPEDFGDPARVLSITGQKGGQFAAIGVVAAAASAFAVVFALGLAYRLREAAPTRALVQLYFAVIGLAAFAIDSLVRWLGGSSLVALAAKDQVAANHAFAALNGVGLGLQGTGNAFTGVSLLIAAWAIISTAAMRPLLGWVAVIAGVLAVLTVFLPTQPLVFFGGFLFTIVWLLWAGNELRRGPMR